MPTSLLKVWSNEHHSFPKNGRRAYKAISRSAPTFFERLQRPTWPSGGVNMNKNYRGSWLALLVFVEVVLHTSAPAHAFVVSFGGGSPHDPGGSAK